MIDEPTVGAEIDAGLAPLAVRIGMELAAERHPSMTSVRGANGSYRWWLARALWATGRRDDACTAARTAERELESDPDGGVECAAVHAWLAAHSR